MRKCLILFALLLFALSYNVSARDVASDDTGTLGADQWSVTSGGDLLPNANTYDIGSTSYSPAKICVGGNCSGGFEENLIKIGPDDFYLENATSSNASPVLGDTVPGLEIKNNKTAIVWADGETDKVWTTFRVPPFSGTLQFRALTDHYATSGTKPALDYEIYYDTNGSAWDSTAGGAAATILTKTYGTPELATLTEATDLSSVSAGDWVTIRLWRDDANASTAQLELYYLELYDSN